MYEVLNSFLSLSSVSLTGNCVEESGRRLISYNCSKFRTGCPGENFDLNTIYKCKKTL